MRVTTPAHHPSAQILANLLTGDCSPGAALLVAKHIALCPQCASRVQAMGSVRAAAAEVDFEAPQMLRPGVEIAHARGVGGLGELVLRVCADPGEPLPIAEPFAAAEILVLEGAFTVGRHNYRAGDFLSLEEHPAKELVSDLRRGCLCLITYADEFGVMAD
jgi:anti-sigma factor ChrR (cupin superfamily)